LAKFLAIGAAAHISWAEQQAAQAEILEQQDFGE
jgi:hypothetical protein